MQNRLAGICAGALMLLAAGAVAAESFHARLGRVPVDSRTQSEVQGLGSADAELDGDRLVITGEFAGLVGAATEASLHMGAAVGARGPAIRALEVTESREGKLSGSVRLDAEQVSALRAGRLYIQIQSETAPDGNLWGWLLSK
jgi:CHRD domain